MQKKYELNMCQGSVLKTVLLFAFPLMLSSILQLMYNSADLIVVSRFAGSNAMAAVGATAAPTSLMLKICMGLSLGASVTVARAFGAQDADRVHKAVHTAILLSAILGLVAGVAGFVFARPLLELMNTPEGEVLNGAVLYMKMNFIGVPASIVFNFGAAILRAIGDTKQPLYILAITGLLNVVLNLVFVMSFGMGVFGVALSTLMANYLSAFMVLRKLTRTDGLHRLNLRALKIYKDSFISILRIGIPTGIQSSLLGIANAVVQAGVNSFGEATVAGVTASGNIEGFIEVSVGAFYQATLTGVSQNYGAKNEKYIKKYMYVPMLCSVTIALLLGGLSVVFAKPLLGIYIADSPAAIEIGTLRLLCTTLPYFLMGITECLVGTIYGLGYSTVPAATSFISVCGVRAMVVTLVLTQPALHTHQMLFAAWPISWIFVLICHSITLMVIKPKAMKKMLEQE